MWLWLWAFDVNVTLTSRCYSISPQCLLLCKNFLEFNPVEFLATGHSITVFLPLFFSFFFFLLPPNGSNQYAYNSPKLNWNIDLFLCKHLLKKKKSYYRSAEHCLHYNLSWWLLTVVSTLIWEGCRTDFWTIILVKSNSAYTKCYNCVHSQETACSSL